MSLALLTSHRVSLAFVDIVLVHPKKVNRTKSIGIALIEPSDSTTSYRFTDHMLVIRVEAVSLIADV